MALRVYCSSTSDILVQSWSWHSCMLPIPWLKNAVGILGLYCYLLRNVLIVTIKHGTLNMFVQCTHDQFLIYLELIAPCNFSTGIQPLVLWHCWLGFKKSIQPVKKFERWGAGTIVSGTRCKWFAYASTDATATHVLVHSNLEWFNLSGASVLGLSWKRGR